MLRPVAVSSQRPSGNINAVPKIIKLIRPVAISINASSGNINIVLEIYTYTLSGYLNTTEIEKHIHRPSGHINTVSINSTYMLSGNRNTCAINKYTNTLHDDNRAAATWFISTSSSYLNTRFQWQY